MARRLYLPGVARKVNKVGAEKVFVLEVTGNFRSFF